MKLHARGLNFIENRLTSLAYFFKNLFQRILGNALISETTKMKIWKLCMVYISYFSEQAWWVKGRNKTCIGGTKSDFTLSGYSFKGRESSLIWIDQWNILTFQCDVDCIPHHQSVYGMQRKIYNLFMNDGMQTKIGQYNLCMNRELFYCELLDRIS